MNRLAGKTALVTAAGAGIGRATAEAFAAQGARVLATDIDAVALADLAAEETDGLYSHAPIPLDEAGARFAEACGARLRRRQLHFEASIEILLDHITPLLTRLRRRDGAGAEMRIAPLAEAPADEVAWMIAQDLGGGPWEAERRVRARAAMAPDGDGPGGTDRSQVILRDGHVAGVIIWRVEDDGVAMVDARMVSPRWRGGPINLMLLEAGLLRGKAEGLTRVRFYCDDTITDTIRLAQRCAADETAILGHYYYPIRD